MTPNTKKLLAENETIRIMYEHFMDQYKDEGKAIKSINYIGEQVKQPGCKLIHLGNIVFMISVSASHMVEMHAMIGGHLSDDKKLDALDAQLDELLRMLKQFDAKLAYTYMPKNKVAKFRKVLKEYKFFERPVQHEGKTYTAFYVEV